MITVWLSAAAAVADATAAADAADAAADAAAPAHQRNVDHSTLSLQWLAPGHKHIAARDELERLQMPSLPVSGIKP